MQRRDGVWAGGRLLLSGLGGWLPWSWDSALSRGLSAEPFPSSPRADLPAQGAERWVLPLKLAGGHRLVSIFLRTGKDQLGGRAGEKPPVRVESQVP